MNCRFCAFPLGDAVLDLGCAPPSNAFLRQGDLALPEIHYPLRLFTCSQCLLVQVGEVPDRETLFADDYVYHSSFSTSWLAHAKAYVEMTTARLGLDRSSLVVEIASNDGYLLQYMEAGGIPCVGIEPTAGTAAVAVSKGIETLVRFFGKDLAGEFVAERGQAHLVVANNVLAHVPDLNDFVAGIAALLAPAGTLTVEFPHLLELVANRQFDTVYHEHYSYFSLHAVRRVFAAHGLRIWDVEKLPTHGGSLRVWAIHANDVRASGRRVQALINAEKAAGMLDAAYYRGLQLQANTIKNEFLAFLLEQTRDGRKVVGYGAAAKGNTLINYAGIRRDLLRYVVDASPHKQGLYLPGSRIPVVAESHLLEDRPDIVVILPWNLRDEITTQLAYIREWGGRFAVAVPHFVLL
jgi:SAM-dependent methyltransferase